ncbi:hypothetical protein SLEP1_g19414 [Rubroshorea leprosula]|nr:hypothetical protein SLEP1_g19414 [Rubroshorea leprosula]
MFRILIYFGLKGVFWKMALGQYGVLITPGCIWMLLAGTLLVRVLCKMAPML